MYTVLQFTFTFLLSEGKNIVTFYV